MPQRHQILAREGDRVKCFVDGWVQGASHGPDRKRSCSVARAKTRRTYYEENREAEASYQKAWLEEKRSGEVPDDKHGTPTGYITYACRCAVCRAWSAKNQREIRAGDHVPNHGTASGYSTYGCRCDLCKAARPEVPERAHGRSSGYTYYRCRCEKCRAWSRDMKAKKRSEKAAEAARVEA